MRRCILVVDDDTMNLRRTKMILEKFYDVVLAEDRKSTRLNSSHKHCSYESR